MRRMTKTMRIVTIRDQFMGQIYPKMRGWTSTGGLKSMFLVTTFQQTAFLHRFFIFACYEIAHLGLYLGAYIGTYDQIGGDWII